MELYFDNAATTRVCPEAAEAALKMMTEEYGNPSATYTLGRSAKACVDHARKQIADALGCRPEELYFTSCGSEGDNWALLSGARMMRRKGMHIISSQVEHDAVRRSLDALEKEGYKITRLAPNTQGGIDPEQVAQALRADTILVSLMMVNNETGAVTDIAAVARMLKKAGSQALLHTDAVQAFLKVPFRADRLGADLITISGHKIHAPKGIGALYIRSGLKLPPYILGGGQERGMRAGTEATPQIAAFGAAAEIGKARMADAQAHMAQLRKRAVAQLSASIDDIVFIGGGAPHILSLSLPGYRSEVLMNDLESRQIYTSKSSACKKGGRSHVLEAMGLPARVIDGALRISFSRDTTQEEVDALCAALADAHERLFPALR
ncbi:MAG: cysteine desulfurase [Oscillospiraceae bacterium]|nr:cysteine desulfurase [Oscillospiraceae bacterium]